MLSTAIQSFVAGALGSLTDGEYTQVVIKTGTGLNLLHVKRSSDRYTLTLMKGQLSGDILTCELSDADKLSEYLTQVLQNHSDLKSAPELARFISKWSSESVYAYFDQFAMEPIP